ncbi:MAG TPA: YbjN domain-containing protein [Micromonospora sp.]
MTPEELLIALEEARDLPDGPEKVTELERIARLADAIGDLRLGVEARFELLEAHQYHTERWRILPLVNWCLATFDQHPSIFDDEYTELLRWHHKWAVATVPTTPRIDLADGLAALDDLARRYEAAGLSPRAIYQLRCVIADHVGDEEAAREWLARWQAAPRDDTSDCAGCEPVRQAELLARWGDWAEAVAVVEPVLRGELRCTEQPESALAAVMLPYLHLGRLAEAAEAHVVAYRRHRFERDRLGVIAQHLRFCALSGHLTRGLDVLDAHLGWLDAALDEAAAMEFATAGALVCRLASAHGLGARHLHRPGYGDRPAADIEVRRLGPILATIAHDLAARFDARNGTDHQSRRVAASLAAEPICDPMPLPPDDPQPAPLPATDQPRGWPDTLAPLSVAAIARVLTERGDHYVVDDDGVLIGQWGPALIHFERLGERREILHSRVIATRRFPADRLLDALEFCNAWNHDQALPKAYVHDDRGELILAGEVTTDLEHGVTGRQLGVLINSVIATGIAFATAVERLP